MDTYKVTLRVNHRCIGSGNEATAEGPASQEGHSELPKGERDYACIFFDMVQGRKDGVNINIESKHIKLLKTSASGEWSMGLWEKSCCCRIPL